VRAKKPVSQWPDHLLRGESLGSELPGRVAQLQQRLAVISQPEQRVSQCRRVTRRHEDGGVAATAFLAYNAHRLMTHWLWAYTVMVHPRHQGRGYGRTLMAAVERAARGFHGIEAIRLTCRGGTGVDTFYAGCGYKEVGRVPAAIRVAPGDDRDDIIMLLPL